MSGLWYAGEREDTPFRSYSLPGQDAKLFAYRGVLLPERVILSLCDYTGVWSEPYEEAGYCVIRWDLRCGQDIRLMPLPKYRVRGILTAPPCDHLAGSGARWWSSKGEEALLDGLSVVDASLRFVAMLRPEWWVLENPVGRLATYLGEPTHIFNPCDYGGYPGGEQDNYTKKTCLWGNFRIPEPKPIPPTDGSRMHRLPPSEDRKTLRSTTPKGFAQAFFLFNP